MGRKVPIQDTPEPGSSMPSGVYLATIEDITEEHSRSGKLMYNVQFNISEPEKGVHFERFTIGTNDDPEADDPQTWTTKATFGTRNFVKLLKQSGAKISNDLDRTIEAALGQSVLIQLQYYLEPETNRDGTPNPYAGDARNKLQRIYRVGERQPEVLDDDKPGGKKKAAKPAAAPKKVKPTRARARDDEDDTDEDDEDEDEAPPPRAKKAKRGRPVQPDPEDEDDDDEE